MAADQVLLEHVEEFGKPILRFYGWDRPSISFGRSQLYPVNIPARYAVVRRPTGGGVVWHDDDFTYTIVLPPRHVLGSLTIAGSYRFFHEAILSQLDGVGFLRSDPGVGVDPRTMQCFVSPSKFDIMGSADTKFAGAAQVRSQRGLMNQGSVRLEAARGDWTRMKDKMLRAFECAAHAEYHPWFPSVEFLAEVSETATEQYECNDWNRDGALPPSKIKSGVHK